ncbi:hypothetical protein [Streptomyces scopuliridis]|uniref:hypothetical protein n=1 Tax=Streptomyces scopuliridis TaxID=452529 RepID=UPI0034139E0E
MKTTAPVTADSILARHAADIAFVAEEKPATTLEDFISQLQTASHNLGYFAGINGAEDLDGAATILTAAIDATGTDRDVLVRRAAVYLANTADMVDEYRLMV